MTAFNTIKNCRYGKMIYNTKDAYIGKSLDIYGEFSEGEVALFRQLVEPGNTVLEVGANIGCHTIVLSQLVGDTGLVYAFEPQRLVFQLLAGNIALNSLTNVYCYQKAVGETPGSLLVPVLDSARVVNWGGLALGQWTTGEKVVRTTVDRMELDSCHLLKVDVEGMEINVLRGARQTIAQYKPVIYVENDRQERSADLIRYIASLDYEMYWHMPPLYNADNYEGCVENVFGPVVSVNMLCLHKSLHPELVGFEKVAIS